VTAANEWSFPFEEMLHESFPALHDAQSSWLSQVDSLQSPDRKTHELIRLVCTVILRNPAGIRRHAQLAREVGAEWDEVLGSIMLTVPGFGMLAAVEAMPVAREGFDAARPPEADGDGGHGGRTRPVPDPAAPHRPQPGLLDRRPGR
jgi:alkylhydroperoxidase/carboxymuconolactone decarboxylase family protein YurZ